ncbi:Uncharacterised protein [Mycobacteroides abscessus subsp. abscessus]|nr:Uncharacterised protein [Mycobacteroides abscessus subsp. abscessus]
MGLIRRMTAPAATNSSRSERMSSGSRKSLAHCRLTICSQLSSSLRELSSCRTA